MYLTHCNPRCNVGTVMLYTIVHEFNKFAKQASHLFAIGVHVSVWETNIIKYTKLFMKNSLA